MSLTDSPCDSLFVGIKINTSTPCFCFYSCDGNAMLQNHDRDHYVNQIACKAVYYHLKYCVNI